MSVYYCPKRRTNFSIANMLTSNWGRFKGPPSASEWTFGSAGRSNAVKKRKLRTPEKVGTKASSSHRHMQGSEPPQKDATSPYSRNVTNPSKQSPKPGTHTHNMATTSSKTVQTPHTQTHDWQARLNQSQNIFCSALHRQLPSIQPPLRRSVNPTWSAVFGSGLEGVAQLATLVLEEDTSSEREVE